MAKLSRSMLKGIVKECLLEILSEGITTSKVQLSESIVRKKIATPQPGLFSSKPKQKRKTNPALDNTSYTNYREKIVEQRRTTTVNALTDDPILSEIFRDTMDTTLQEQLGNATPASSQPGPEIRTKNNDISEVGMFNDAANNWAALAFTEKKQSN